MVSWPWESGLPGWPGMAGLSINGKAAGVAGAVARALPWVASKGLVDGGEVEVEVTEWTGVLSFSSVACVPAALPR